MDCKSQSIELAECDDYDWELYYRISNMYVPKILQNAYKTGYKFYVKGGRAVDAYLRHPIGSPDWDIIAEDMKGLAEYIFIQSL